MATKNYQSEGRSARANLALVTDETEVTYETRTERRVVGAVRPLYMSQHTSMPTTGIDGRGYLGLLPEYRAAGGEVIAVGKRRLVLLTDFAAWLRRRSEAQAAAPEPQDDVDTYAASLGLRVVGGGR
jgi:hypothetical protein